MNFGVLIMTIYNYCIFQYRIAPFFQGLYISLISWICIDSWSLCSMKYYNVSKWLPHILKLVKIIFVKSTFGLIREIYSPWKKVLYGTYIIFLPKSTIIFWMDNNYFKINKWVQIQKVLKQCSSVSKRMLDWFKYISLPAIFSPFMIRFRHSCLFQY